MKKELKFLLGIVVTFVISYFFFFLSQKEREPVFTFKNKKTLIFDKHNATPKIKLFTNDTIPIKENVYISNIVLWNNGQIQIDTTEIRKRFSVNLINGKILDYKIVKEISDISHFELIEEKDKLHIDWKYFDPGFGVEI